MMPPGRSQQRCHLGGHRERDKGGLRPHSIQSPFSNQRCNGCSELSLSLMLLLFLVVVISVFFSDLHFKTRVQGRVPGKVARLLVPGCDRITGSDQEREATRSLSEAPRCFFT